MKSRFNLAVALLVGFTILGGLFWAYGYQDTWRLWAIEPANPPFMDVRVITDGAAAYRTGLDPMQSNRTDTSKRRLNYPRAWQLLYKLGLDRQHAIAFGVISILLFALGVAVAAPGLDGRGTLLMMAAIFSPAVMLGMERGNTDLLMFFLLAMAAATAGRAVVWPVMLVLAGFVLKLYPLFGLAVMAGRRRDVVVRVLGVAAAFAVLYLLFTWDDLIAVSALTPRSTWLSYGMNVLWMRVAEHQAGLGVVLRGLSYVAVLGVAWLGVRAWRANDVSAKTTHARHIDSFRVGAACYLGTFLLGNNFNYRLMFLVLAIPQLWMWATQSRGKRRTTARATLTAIYVLLWTMMIVREFGGGPWGSWTSFLIGEAAAWTVFGGLAGLAGATMPAWLWRGSGRVSPETRALHAV